MMILGHRARVALLATLFALLALMFFTRRANAGWSADPVEVHATSALCPLVSAAPDGAHGALIIWQEATASGGLLRARRLLANGDLDAGWSAPVSVSTADVVRPALGSVSDGAGGAYVWWMEGTQLYLTRLAAEGAVATGWPANGRVMGSLVSPGSRPVVCADGSGGVYAAWLTGSAPPVSRVTIRAHHLGSANTAKDGWPSGGRTLAGTQANDEHATTFNIEVASDGGLWLAFATTVEVEPGVYTPGEARVARYDGAGLPAAGWTTAGVTLAPFRGDLLATSSSWGLAPHMRLAAVVDDGSGGAFVQFPTVQEFESQVWVSGRLMRVDATGATAAGWPAGGIEVSPVAGLPAPGGATAELSLRLHAGPGGGVFVGHPEFYDHGVSYTFDLYSSDGVSQGESLSSGATGLESSPRGDGGLVSASFYPTGPNGPFQPTAHLRVSQTEPGATFFEWHAEPVIQWYGDIGLAATGDGGSIFAWSQVNERQGVFAIRMNPGGQVTGVPPGAATRALRVWFARGAGVQVAGETGPMTLRLHDLTGREVARGESADAGEWTVPGTASLPSGMYFAKVVADGQELRKRVIVVR